ncbi:MAG TPA: HEAT repeat domain-containing protein [Planctomycetota bacterium]|nr:HEAT repeat domain-containing protein [Planctomycetota bacterium]
MSKDSAPDAGVPLDEEPEQHVPGSFLGAMPQFFIFPLILVITLTAAYFGLRMLVGFQADTAPELVAAIRGAGGPGERWQSMHALADGLRRGEPKNLDDVPASELAALYADFADDSPQSRQFLLQVIGWKRAPELTALAVAALADGDPDVRLSALYALSQAQDPASVPDLVGVLHGAEPAERFLALGALASIGSPPARDAVAGQLTSEDGILRRNAALALAAAGDSRAAPYLPALLDRAGYEGDPALGDPDPTLDEASRQVKRADVVEQFLVSAARAAGKLGDRSLAPKLEQMRANDPSLKVRSAAINALHDMDAAADARGEPPNHPR